MTTSQIPLETVRAEKTRDLKNHENFHIKYASDLLFEENFIHGQLKKYHAIYKLKSTRSD